MSLIAFHLVSLKNQEESPAFLRALRSLPETHKAVWVGDCQHWIHEPHLSRDVLLGSATQLHSWDYLVACKTLATSSLELPEALAASVSGSWTITTTIDDAQLDSLQSRLAAMKTRNIEPLPHGWSPGDHSGLDNSEAPTDVAMSLDTSSRVLKADGAADAIKLKSFVGKFGKSHPGPIVMFNLLSFFPNKQHEYMNYIAAFKDISYGGEAVLFGFDPPTWSSQKEEEEGGTEGGWEGTAIVRYPSIWHFAKMLDDPRYANLDRKFKVGVVRDNPLICCIPVEESGWL
jgi:hypothetical protein